MKSLSAWISGRLSEPTTYLGLAMIATTVQNALATGDWKSVLGTAVGALAALLKEKGATA